MARLFIDSFVCTLQGIFKACICTDRCSSFRLCLLQGFELMSVPDLVHPDIVVSTPPRPEYTHPTPTPTSSIQTENDPHKISWLSKIRLERASTHQEEPTFFLEVNVWIRNLNRSEATPASLGCDSSFEYSKSDNKSGCIVRVQKAHFQYPPLLELQRVLFDFPTPVNLVLITFRIWLGLWESQPIAVHKNTTQLCWDW